MKIKKKISQTYKRFLIFYMIFACVLMSTYIPLYSYVHNVTYENICKNVRTFLSGGVASLETSTRTVINAYNATYNDSAFRPLRFSKGLAECSPSELRTMVRKLSYLLIPSDMVFYSGIVRNEDTAIMHNRSFWSERFYSLSDFFTCGSMTFSEWKQWTESCGNNGAWLPEQGYHIAESSSDYSALTYARIWYNSSSSEPIVYFALLNTDWLVAKLAEPSILQNGCISISDANGAMLLTRGKTDDPDFLSIEQYSPATGLTVRVGIPSAYLKQHMRPLKSMMTWYIAVLVMLAATLVLLFSRRSAAPMHRLMGVLGQSPVAADIQPASRGFWNRMEQDYEMVSHSIAHLSNRVQTTEELIHNQAQQLRDHLFERALYNALYTSRDEQDFHKLFENFPKLFQLVLLRSDSSFSVEKAVQHRTNLLQLAQQCLPGLYYAHVSGSGAITLVVRQTSVDELQALHDQVIQSTDFSMTCRILLTQPFSDVSQLAAAYEQAQSLAFSNEKTDVVTYTDFHEKEAARSVLPLSISALQEMYNALIVGDDALALVIMDDCAETLLHQPDQLMIARHTHSMISHMLAQLKLEYLSILFPVIIPGFEANELRELYTQELPQCMRQIGQLLREKQSSAYQLSDQVMAFISEKLFSPDMCVTYVSDHFGIAKATLQKIIKEANGETFSAYISNQRLERAHKLLATSELSVQQISDMCGFSSTNSFYKAFRKKYGIAPSAVSELMEES